MQDPLYEQLAKLGRSHGYPLTASAVHLWAMRGLLLPPIDCRPGFGRRLTSLRPGAQQRLLRVCHLRFDDGYTRLDWIGTVLWLEGEAIPLELVRSAIRRHLAGTEPGRWPRGSQLDKIAQRVTATAAVRTAMAPMAAQDASGPENLTFAIANLVATGNMPTDEMLAEASLAFDIDVETVRSTLAAAAAHAKSELWSVASWPDSVFECGRSRWVAGGFPKTQPRSDRLRIRMKATMRDLVTCLTMCRLDLDQTT